VTLTALTFVTVYILSVVYCQMLCSYKEYPRRQHDWVQMAAANNPTFRGRWTTLRGRRCPQSRRHEAATSTVTSRFKCVQLQGNYIQQLQAAVPFCRRLG
jgi:hypothetical protein